MNPWLALPAVLCSLGLSGCVVVGSSQPLFGVSSAADAPKLRPGVWSLNEGECGYDAAKPAAEWPDCAQAVVVTEGNIHSLAPQSPGDLAYVLATNDPPVIQLKAPSSRKPNDPEYVYAALRPLKRDAQGRITEARAWLVLCAKPIARDQSADNYKPEPLPGLTLQDGSCLASASAPVLRAAKESEAWLTTGSEPYYAVARWVRDGDR